MDARQVPAPPAPTDLFDREQEWADLTKFAIESLDGPHLGLVYGRRRHGKTYLLEHVAAASEGFYYQAIEEERHPALERFAAAVGAFAGAPAWAGARFPDWAAALRVLAEAAAGRLLVIDEFPYLLRGSPELPSIIQAAFDAARVGRHPAFRLVLCGSALSVMTELLTGQRALRGRASLDLALEPFNYRQARSYWRIADHRTAFLVDAVVGGAPGYRDLLDGRAPAGPGEFADWLAAGVLNPSHALFREADYLLTEDPGLVDRSLYRSIVAAVAEGSRTIRDVARALGRPETALGHPLRQLIRSRFLVRHDDVFRPRRPLLSVADPLLRFFFAVVRPDLPRFEARRTKEAWLDAESRFRAQVVGPHFEAIARRWTERYAAAETLGGRPSRVGFAQVNDPAERRQFELDVVALGAPRGVGGRPVVLAIGEAKASESPLALGELERLERLRARLAARADVSRTKLLLFGLAGFEAALRRAVRGRPDVELVDLERCYEGE
jgi:AAA+ ATPase superfamily predicted ATPase